MAEISVSARNPPPVMLAGSHRPGDSDNPQADARLDISLPTIHCAACMSKVERGLKALDFVTDARVNLSLKRVQVLARPGVEFETKILATLAGLGYQAHLLDAGTLGTTNGATGTAMLRRLGVAGFALMNVMILSVSVWAGAEGATRAYLIWLSALIAMPALAYAATPFFNNALSALRVGRLNMDVPISLAIVMATGLSLSEAITGGPDAYFDAALSLTFFLLLGRYLDHATRAGARSAARALAALEIPRVTVISGPRLGTVALADVVLGDRVQVLPGMRVPVDGKVSNGCSDVDKSLLTGETMPGAVTPGSVVHAGTLNLTGRLEVTVTGLGEQTLLRRMAQLVRLAEGSKNRYTSLAEKAARIYAPGVHILALLAFLFWQFWTGDTRLALYIATSVLIITCPCALGLAVPAVMTAATGRLFRAGILVKDGTALERLSQVDTVVFDKTGTLTSGTPTLTGSPSDQVLMVAAGLARHSAHPYSVEILRAALAKGLTPADVDDVAEQPGWGVYGTFEGQPVHLGRTDAVPSPDDAPPGLHCWLRLGDKAPVCLHFSDSLKDQAPDAIRTLHRDGLKTALLSGDRAENAADVADRLGIETRAGGVLPEAKIQHIQHLGDRVLMVGDGLNDAPALAAAHVSMAPAKAIDVARTAADFVLLQDDLTLIPACIRLARSARRRILQNFTIAACYNAVAIPVALAGYATPLVAAIAMSASSICVSLNALRLRGERL